ncbi:MAG TPA: hypothetical protein PLZ62_03220 [bacterium]|nr:hypothetical protein [bacterium]
MSELTDWWQGEMPKLTNEEMIAKVERWLKIKPTIDEVAKINHFFMTENPNLFEMVRDKISYYLVNELIDSLLTNHKDKDNYKN